MPRHKIPGVYSLKPTTAHNLHPTPQLEEENFNCLERLTHLTKADDNSNEIPSRNSSSLGNIQHRPNTMFPSNSHNRNRQNAPVLSMVAPPQEDPIYGAWIEYLMVEMTEQIHRGSLDDFVPTLTPQQLSGEENQEPLDAVPWVAPEDFRPYSEDELLQLDASWRLSQGANSYFMQVDRSTATDGSAGPGFTRHMYEFSHNNHQGRNGNQPQVLAQQVPAFLQVQAPLQVEAQAQVPPRAAQGPPQAAQVLEQADGYLQGPQNPRYSVLNYTENYMPASGLIRDSVAPHFDDFSNEALVWRVASSATGRQTNFTFADHWTILYDSIHSGLVNELNRKLEVGIDGIENKVLLRNIPENYMHDPVESQMITFSKMGM